MIDAVISISFSLFMTFFYSLSYTNLIFVLKSWNIDAAIKTKISIHTQSYMHTSMNAWTNVTSWQRCHSRILIILKSSDLRSWKSQTNFIIFMLDMQNCDFLSNMMQLISSKFKSTKSRFLMCFSINWRTSEVISALS